MFTVLVRETRNDCEVVFPATQVRKHLFEGRKDTDQYIGEVVCDCPDGSGSITYSIRASAPSNGSDDQVLFVMNEQGATVAKYFL